MTRFQLVAQQFREVLLRYRERAEQAGQGMVAYSALPIGADQLFVRTALELAIPVEVIIPCAQDEAICSAEAYAEYVRLLSQYQHVQQLPLQECSDDAYLASVSGL